MNKELGAFMEIFGFGKKKNCPKTGFTLIETMVGMVVLAVGLLGMAGMILWIMRSNRGANDLFVATNLCQMKIQELKDVKWEDLGTYEVGDEFEPEEIGLPDGAMVREGSLNVGQGLNKDGVTRAQEFAIQSDSETATPGNPCLNSTDTPGSECAKYLDSVGPYKYIRSFVICKGEDYLGTLGNAQAPTTPIDTTYKAPPVASAPRPITEPACRVDPTNNQTRYEHLACRNEDIATAPGDENLEKKIRISCAWRTREGECHTVDMDTTVVEF